MFTVKGKTLVAGRDTITITAHDPNFNEEANSDSCCFGRPGVKVTVIKKFLMAPLHISGEENGLVPPPSSVGILPQHQVLTLPLHVEDYPPASVLECPTAPQHQKAPQYSPTTQYCKAPQHPQTSPYIPASEYPPLAPKTKTGLNLLHMYLLRFKPLLYCHQNLQ